VFKIGCFTIIVFLALVLIGLFVEHDNLENGYKYINVGRSDYFHISKNDNMFIRNAVLDINEIGHYVVGLQLPRCPNTHPQKIILSTNKTYFILNTKNDNVVYFSSKNKFLDELKNLELFEKVTLNYHFFNNMNKTTQENYRRFFTEDQMEECNKHLTSH